MGRARSLDGQVVVVTGAARGIGALVAQRLAAQCARVALLGLEPAELGMVSAVCGPESRWWEVDVTDEAALADVAASVRDAYGRVDVVVANAGIAAGGPFLHSDARSFTRVIEVNLLGSVATARAFLPALLESKGYLLQVASLAAITPAPMMAAYCASKSGVEAFAHCVRGEVAHRGVDVGVAYLSWIDTDMVRGADENAALREMRAGLPYPVGRTYPAGPAADALVNGIARRAPHVYAQRWLPPMQLVRGLVPSVVSRFVARGMSEIESRWLTSGGVSTPVGAGGAADTAVREAAGTVPQAANTSVRDAAEAALRDTADATELDVTELDVTELDVTELDVTELDATALDAADAGGPGGADAAAADGQRRGAAQGARSQRS